MSNNDPSRRVPPSHAQFRPGTSGNPKGRPKGSKNLNTVLEKELQDKVSIRENGKVKRIPKLEAAIKTNVAKTIQGDPRHATILMKNIEKLEGGGSQTASSISDDQRQDILARHEARQRARFFEEFQKTQGGGEDR